MALLSSGLLPATFRGVPFAVRTSSSQFGRRLAVHQYPGRDDPWVEDMGRGVRRFRFSGFLVTDDRVYAGGPVELQRALLISAAEQSGPGTLTHPTLGVLKVAVASLSVSDPLEAGRYSEIEFDLVEAGKAQFPSILTSTGSGILSAATLAKVAIAADVVSALRLAVAAGSSRDAVVPVAAAWSTQVEGGARDATSLTRLTSLLPGNFGRYAHGANAGFAGSNTTPYAADTTIAALATDSAGQRAVVASAANAVASAGGTDAVVPTTIALVDGLLGACADPADALRLLSRLASFRPAAVGASTLAGAVVSDLFRRAAVIAMAEAGRSYQPSSYDDAFATMSMIASALDEEITVAGDAGLDATFNALRALRAAVVQDFRARGATLSVVVTFSTAAPLPAVVLAQRFYRDAGRADELLGEAGCPHPLFMPTELRALAA